MNTLKEFIDYIGGKNKKIICFGTGLMAEEALTYPVIREHVDLFADNDASRQGKRIRIGDGEFDVISPSDLCNRCSSAHVILITSGHYKAVRKQIEGLGLPKDVEVYDFPVLKVMMEPKSDDFFEERILKECLKEYDIVLSQRGIIGEERVEKLREKEQFIRGKGKDDRPFVVPRVMIMPTTRCNLRCKGCSSLLPLFEHPMDVEAGQILKDIDVFFSGVDECIRLTVGGEPFLYNDLGLILERLVEEPKLLGIMLITNGVKQPDESVIPFLKDRKVLVEVSDYGRIEQMSKTITILEKNGVNFKVLTEQKWTDMGDTSKRGRTKEEIRFVYMNCDQGRVIKGMHDGRFHTCARSARMLALGAYESDNDYFSMHSELSSVEVRKELMEMYYSDFADACDYCDLGALPTKVIDAGIQMSGNTFKSKYTIVERAKYEKLCQMAQIVE